jgi:[ribosomal protein S18]-alanine N-acetyltransferase
MIIPNSIATLTSTDHPKVIQLFRRMPRQHIHLDWHLLEEWLNMPSLRCHVAMRNGSIEALLGATIDDSNPPAAWLRFAVPPMWGTYSTIMTGLWEALLADLRLAGVHRAGVLDIDGWMARYIKHWGFAESNAVVTLRRQGFSIPDALPTTATIRPASSSDLNAIVAVDRAAFGPLWRYNQSDIASAADQASIFTAAEIDRKIIGYQLSTRYAGSGHLARLAIHPQYQGQKIGGALIYDMMRFFFASGIDVITVNTQADNMQSQRLYQRFGFEITGHQVPVWTLDL